MGRRELLTRIEVLREQVRELGIAALAAERTKACDRAVSGLLDSLNALAAILSVSGRQKTQTSEKHPNANQQ
jgi:hypothetical protein